MTVRLNLLGNAHSFFLDNRCSIHPNPPSPAPLGQRRGPGKFLLKVPFLKKGDLGKFKDQVSEWIFGK